jgi:hypothetical protein
VNQRSTFLIAAFASLSVSARADRRAYDVTYEAVTASQGELDVESWTTYAANAEFPDAPASLGDRTMLELEYGITDRWDVALYNMIDIGTQNPGYAGFKLETRYRLSLPGEWFVDPVLYLEYQRLFMGNSADTLELKAIVGKDIGAWNISVNVSVELENLIYAGITPEYEYAAGVSREVLGPALKLGVEVFGSAEQPPPLAQGQPAPPLAVYTWVGPAISWATTFEHGMRGVWVTVGAGRGVTNDSPTYYGRGIVGLQF